MAARVSTPAETLPPDGATTPLTTFALYPTEAPVKTTVYVAAGTASEYAPEALVVAVVVAGTVDTWTPAMGAAALLVTLPVMVELLGPVDPLTAATEKESNSTGDPDEAQP
jgi:hypothetical protein